MTARRPPARHHVTDELLVAYEAGSLAEGWSLAVATHLAYCPDCRARAREASALGGALLEDLPGEVLADDAFDRVLDRIAAAPGAAAPAEKEQHSAGRRLPEPLRSYVGGDLDAIAWRRLGTAGWQAFLKTGDGETTARLLRVKAGEPVPEHGHNGQELTVVLSGALIDGETVFLPGDIEIADEALEHQPRAGEAEDCICLAVTDAPLSFKSLLVRLAQPFLKI